MQSPKTNTPIYDLATVKSLTLELAIHSDVTARFGGGLADQGEVWGRFVLKK
jgi:hypothetical protein